MARTKLHIILIILALAITANAQITKSGLDPKKFEAVVDGQQVRLFVLKMKMAWKLVSLTMAHGLSH